MSAQVLQAFQAAAHESVPLDELQAAASRVIARITGAEAGLVTAGAAAGLMLGTAAILTGYDAGRMECLPGRGDFPCEFIVAREHRNGYDHAVRAAGAVLREVGFHEMSAGAGVRRVEAWEYEAAINPATAGILYVQGAGGFPRLADIVAVAHAHQLPVLVDAAGELPPRTRFRELLETGADLVTFSGGKAIGGPQATGILCGRREYVGPAALQMLDMDDHWELWNPPADWIDRDRLRGFPRHGIGRSLKVSKEQIAALLTALQCFVDTDPAPERAKKQRLLQELVGNLAGLPVRCEIQTPSDGETLPWLEMELALPESAHLAIDLCRRLRLGKPPIYVGHGLLSQGKLVIHPLHLDAPQTEAIHRRIREELLSATAESTAN